MKAVLILISIYAIVKAKETEEANKAVVAAAATRTSKEGFQNKPHGRVVRYTLASERI
jgi:hypothetical protein